MEYPKTCAFRNAILFTVLSTAFCGLGGCEVDSFFDPSKTGYFERTPITVPILERIDVIERGAEEWSNATEVTPADLVPSDLTYEIAPGDVVVVEIHDFPEAMQVSQFIRTVDQAGNVRLPQPLTDFPAAGLTLTELEEAIIATLRGQGQITEPYVVINLQQGRGFTYAVTGHIPGPGVYTLTRPDYRLAEALAQSGGVPVTSEWVYVIRSVALTEEVRSQFQERGPRMPPREEPRPPVDIEELIRELEGDRQDDEQDDGGAMRDERGGGPGMGILHLEPEPPLDVDDFQPRLIEPGPVDLDQVAPRQGAGARRPEVSDTFIFDEERNEWVRVVPQDQRQPPQQQPPPDRPPVLDPGQDITEEVLPGQPEEDLILERIIRIPARKLLSDSSYNIVVRPGDLIYVEPPLSGVVYVGGEVLRPGVYSLPVRGRLTLSQLVTAAGGPGPLAIPDRVDLTRRIAPDRDATIRVSLAAIRQRNEPDIFIKPDDHIIVGTNWLAAPIAVIRNGFRSTYGFGFLLDRNFGNDVFGAPPRSILE